MVTAPAIDRRPGRRVPGPGPGRGAAPAGGVPLPRPVQISRTLPGYGLALALLLALALPPPARGATTSPSDSLDLTMMSLEQLSEIVVAEVDAASGHRVRGPARGHALIVRACQARRLGRHEAGERQPDDGLAQAHRGAPFMRRSNDDASRVIAGAERSKKLSA